MLKGDRVEAAVGRRRGGREQGSVALTQGDDVLKSVEKAEEFAIAPDPALIQRSIAHAAFTPSGSKLRCGGLLALILRFQ